MKRRSYFCLTACIALLGGLAAPSLAQWEAETGSHIQKPAPADIPTNAMSEADRSRVAIMAFGQCVVLSQRSAVERVLALPPFDKATNRKLANLATSDCLRNGEISMPEAIMRGAVYRALYVADFGKAQPALPPAPIDYWQDVGGVSADAAAQEYVGLHQFGDCVVRRDPEHSRKFILSTVGSNGENAALAALVPELGPCVSAGSKLTFSKIMLTSALAEALYRESRAAQLAVVSNGNP